MLIIAELKWPRKPYAPREIVERDSEIQKGISQIKAIRKFLLANPRFFVDRKYLLKSMSDYREIHYCVISRDHLIASKEEEVPVFSYDAFVEEMSSSKSTQAALEFLKSMNWLPVEGKDYLSQWITNRAGGVTVRSELFLLNGSNNSIKVST